MLTGNKEIAECTTFLAVIAVPFFRTNTQCIAKCVLKRRKEDRIVRKIYSRVEHGNAGWESGTKDSNRPKSKPTHKTNQTRYHGNLWPSAIHVLEQLKTSRSLNHSTHGSLQSGKYSLMIQTKETIAIGFSFAILRFSCSNYLNKGLSLCDARHLHWQH